MPKKKTQPIDFEKNMAELTKLVEQLEQGGIPLDKALDQFERGVQLTRECQQALSSAEQKVQQLLKDDLVETTINTESD